MIQAVILAGGSGTRLKPVTGDRPKPLVDICGVPLLGRQLDVIARSACRDVLVLTGYGAEAISDYCGDGGGWGLKLQTVAEPTARGTAGAVLDARDLLAPTFLVLYGDTVLDVDLDRLIDAHERAAPDATLFLHPNDHPHDSDLVELDQTSRIVRFLPYPHPPGVDFRNQVNAGLYVLEREPLLSLSNLPEKPDFGKHIFPAMLAADRFLNAYLSPEYIKDAGTPDRIAKVRHDIETGRVGRMSLRHPVPAVFLDRDGVLNVERGLVTRPGELELLPGAARALARLNRSDYRTIVVTNQAVVARGLCTIAELDAIHARLETLLGAEHAFVDRLYYCPHHPDAGYDGEVKAFKIVCDCRKPSPGMVHQAARDLNIDIAGSWMVGDSSTDMALARSCGMGAILVRTGHAGADGKSPAQPHFVMDDLAESVDFILDRWPPVQAMVAEMAQDIGSSDVVLIGGASRSGKSTLAQALSIVLTRRGQANVVVSLDHWILPHDARGCGVHGRFEIDAAERAVLDMAIHRTPVMPPHYDPMTRTRRAGQLRLDPGPNGVIIFEGVLALATAALRAVARQCWFVEGDEAGRKARFETEYRRRGWTDDEIALTYASRIQDELPVIQATALPADRRVTLDGVFA